MVIVFKLMKKSDIAEVQVVLEGKNGNAFNREIFLEKCIFISYT